MTVLAPDHRPSTSPLFSAELAGHGSRVALVSTAGAITYAELDNRVRAVCARLGDERRLVLIGAGNAVDPLVAYLAALRGGHAVLLAPGANDTTLRALTSAYDPDVMITAGTGWSIDERRPGSAHRLHPDLALLLSTSGSTGSPKLVRLSHWNLQANAEAIAEYLALTPQDRAMTTLPMQYCYGVSVINSHLHIGAGIVLTELSVVDRCFWDLFETAGATSFAGVPHTFDLLDRVGFESMSLPTLRYLTQAGGRLHPDTVRRYASLGEQDGWQLFVMYGQTEATARMAYLPPALASSHPASIGVPIPGGTFTIEAPDQDGVGELVYRGPNVMLGYAEHPSDLALGASVDALRTGDLARLTGEGLYELVGRHSRFVKLYGLRIDLDQVERVLAEYGITSMCTGDDCRLVVAVSTSTHRPTIAQLISDHLGVPRATVVVVGFDELPRLSNGKPDYATVHQQATDGAPTSDVLPCSVELNGDHRAAVRAAFVDVLGLDPSESDSFVSLGGDSLSYVEMSIRLEELLGFLPRDWHRTSVGGLAPAPVRRPGLAHTETSVVLRALAIVLVVGTHTGLWHLPGGAHTLLGVSGYNFARFQLRAPTMMASIARIALPAICWIAIAAAATEDFAWPHALLLNGQLGAPGARWGYWYIEATVQILLCLALLFAMPAVRRLEQHRPFPFALAVLAAGLAVRFDLLGLASSSHRTSRPQDVFWLFALGWLAAQATTTPQRLVVSALAAASLAGFFGDTHREILVTSALLLVVWAPTLPLPRRATPIIGTVAGASLYIYLSHWQIYPPLLRHGPTIATITSILLGIAIWLLARRLTTVAEDTLARTRRHHRISRQRRTTDLAHAKARHRTPAVPTVCSPRQGHTHGNSDAPSVPSGSSAAGRSSDA
ncbi:MAG: AMP-binding protein [Actinomycetota bacterium]